jgi:hypothetical protein
MKRLFLFFLSVFFQIIVHAQNTPSAESFSHRWSEGSVVFKTGDSVRCNLRYNYTASTSILQIAEGGKILTLTPDEISSFEFFDEQRVRDRKFLSMVIDSLQNKHAFVESIFSSDKIMLVSHKKMGFKHKYLYYTKFITKPTRMINRYLFNVSTGQLIPLSKRNALQLMADRQKEVEDFINMNHLKFKNTLDYVQLLKYHSSL